MCHLSYVTECLLSLVYQLFCQVEFETEMMKDKRDKLTQLLMDLMDRQKQRAEDLQVHLSQITNHSPQVTTEDDGGDGDDPGGGAGELLADPVPEVAGQQAQGARGGRGQHGPQGDAGADADLGDQNISDSTFSFDASSLH